VRVANLHARQGWLGDASAFGAAGGVLIGDLALMAAHRTLVTATASLPSAMATQVAALFADMESVVTAGQYLDMRVAAQPLWALENQERDIRDTMITKSASYSVEYPLRLGAALAGSNSGMADALADIGIPLGTAFQLRDDILGLTGAPAVTGKPAGDDIREGKRTIPLLHAWRRADPAQRAQLASTLGVRDADAAAVAQSVALIQSLGGIEATEREIHELTESGLSRLASLDLAPDNHLATLFTQLTRRDF
jgi:geranylgeranyl diphosphate synthase type I